MRRDQWRRVADPLLVPLGELVVPRLRLCHVPTLIACLASTGFVRERLTAAAGEGRPPGMKWRRSLFAGNVGVEGLVPI
jgi:hypothetical protein